MILSFLQIYDRYYYIILREGQLNVILG